MHPPPLLSSLVTITILTFTYAASPTPVSPSLNSTNAQDLYCLEQEDWRKTHWPATAIEDLYEISRRLREGYCRPNQGQEFEFLHHGEMPVTGLPLVHTPFKLKLGTVTLAVTTTHAFAPTGRRDLPALGTGPFPRGVPSDWSMIYGAASDLNVHCLVRYRSAPRAGVKWFTEQGNGLLIMVYATGSDIDHEVGPAVNGLLRLEGSDVVAVSRAIATKD